MEGVEAAQAQAQQVAAEQQAACTSLFTDVDKLITTATDYLAELSKHADMADMQKLRTAALKMRLGQLARERRSREAATAAVMEAKQRELERLLQEERAVQQLQQQAASNVHGDSLPTPFTLPASKTNL